MSDLDGILVMQNGKNCGNQAASCINLIECPCQIDAPVRVAVLVPESSSTRLSEVLCLVGAGEQCPSHYPGLRQATALRPDRLIAPAGDSHLAVSADWLLLLCLWRGRQRSIDDPTKTMRADCCIGGHIS